eukprot:356721-Chlamydomonas_euryale.AAC.9
MSSRSGAVAKAVALCGRAAAVIEAPQCSHCRPDRCRITSRRPGFGDAPVATFQPRPRLGTPAPNADPHFLVSLRYASQQLRQPP